MEFVPLQSHVNQFLTDNNLRFIIYIFSVDSIIPVLDMLSHFHSEPLLTNCERFLMSTNIGQLDGSMLVRLLDKGLCVSLDHRILGRIICVCLLNTATKMSDVSQDLIGTVGSVFAQAFIAYVE